MSDYPRLEYLPLSSLRKNAENPNEQTDPMFNATVESVCSFGFSGVLPRDDSGRYSRARVVAHSTTRPVPISSWT